MGASYNTIKCESISDSKVTFTLDTSVFKEENVLDNKALFLEIIIEFFYFSINETFYTEGNGNQAVLSDEEYLLKAKQSPYYDKLYDLNGLLNGNKISATREHWNDLVKGRNNPAAYFSKYGEQLPGFGSSGNNYFYYSKTDYSKFVLLVNEEINSITILNSIINEDSIMFEVEVSVCNPALLMHLVSGTKWTSAIYIR